jgi:hypothetical protein
MSIEERFLSGFSVGISYGLQSFCFLYAHHAELLLAASIIHHKKTGDGLHHCYPVPFKN